MTTRSNQLITDYKFRNIDIQHFSKERINQLQVALLQEHLKYLAENSPFYKTHFQKYNINISNIKTSDDLAAIPTTSKEDLIQYNNDFLAVPETEIIDVCLTSATSGEKPAILLQTHSDFIPGLYGRTRLFYWRIKTQCATGAIRFGQCGSTLGNVKSNQYHGNCWCAVIDAQNC